MTVRNGNYSAFSGYHRTYSDYSEIRCSVCGSSFRSKANYVLRLKNAEDAK